MQGKGMGVAYCTREAVKAALDIQSHARDAQIDRLIQSASRHVESLCHRKFYPQNDTRYFDWPDAQMGRSWRLWLDANELISATSITSGGNTVVDYFLRPYSGPPYTHVELDLSGGDNFGGGATWQRDVTIAGVFGYGADEATAGTAAEALDASETGVDVSNSAVVGVGDLIRVDSERMLVTEKTWLTTGATLAGTLTANKAEVSVPVSSGAAFNAGETILVDSEQMQVVAIAGNTLTVRRAEGGSVLAAHSSGVTAYAPRTLTVTRGACGTVAATHSADVSVYRHEPPSPVTSYALAWVVYHLQREQGAYASSTPASSGSGMRVTRSELDALCEEVYSAYGRKARKRVV